MAYAELNPARAPCRIANHVAIERGLAEFRAIRPVLLVADISLIAMPVDGLDAQRLESFREWGMAPLHLLLTARRAHALGIEAAGPVSVPLDQSERLDAILSLAAGAMLKRRPDGVPAGPAAIAAIELAKLAELLPALMIVKPGQSFANPGVFVEVRAAAVAGFRGYLAQSLRVVACSRVPIRGGIAARLVVFRDALGGSPAALVIGEPDFEQPVPVRLHSACLTGDVFGSRRCDCGDQLKLALARLSRTSGVVLYLAQEGRGLGLANKMRAYELQDVGLDTVDADMTLGFEADERDYRIAARMLQLLGCQRVLLMTNNPTKLAGLSRAGVEICGSVPLQAPIKPENHRYLTTKATRAGHRLDGLWSKRSGGDRLSKPTWSRRAVSRPKRRAR
jgi:GTP cyclohydrolase II